MVRLLDAEQRIADGDADVPIPPGVRAVIGQRLGQLSEPCREMLVGASVLGREFGLDALARLGGVPGDRLLDLLDEAMTERIVGDVPGSPGLLRFGHALIRDTLYDELTGARRLRLHQRAGEALELVYAADPDPHLAELARHFVAAAPAGGADKALRYARRAGDRAARQLAYEEAARHYETALTLAGEPPPRCELLLALGESHARAGDMSASRRAFHEAAELAEAHALPEQLARAALGYGGRIIWEVSRDDPRLLSLLERALAALGDEESILRVRLLARLAGGPLRDASFPPERRAALSAEALRIARRLDDPATLAYALQGYILGHHSPEHTHRQLELANEIIEVAARAGDDERVLEGGEERLDALLELGDVTAAKGQLEAMAMLARKLRQPAQEWLVIQYRALFALLEGRHVEAQAWISEAHARGERAQSWNATVTYRLQMYVLRRQQGRLEEIEDIVRRSVAEYPTYPIWRCVFAQVQAELGHAGEARDALDALAADGYASVPFDEEWLVSIGLLAEAASVLGDGGARAGAVRAAAAVRRPDRGRLSGDRDRRRRALPRPAGDDAGALGRRRAPSRRRARDQRAHRRPLLARAHPARLRAHAPRPRRARRRRAGGAADGPGGRELRRARHAGPCRERGGHGERLTPGTPAPASPGAYCERRASSSA